jgi:hypothetical protein
MKSALTTGLVFFFCQMTLLAQAVYVDGRTGDDKNNGGREAPLFSIQKAVSVATRKAMADRRIVIEASILPDDASWTPDKMPVIANRSGKREIPDNFNFVVSFVINESRVTHQGIQFHGCFYPHTRYFPIARFDRTKTDLRVEQCLFVGDANISQIRVGVIAHGNEVIIDHCLIVNNGTIRECPTTCVCFRRILRSPRIA